MADEKLHRHCKTKDEYMQSHSSDENTIYIGPMLINNKYRQH
jgi:hypothetical protein